MNYTFYETDYGIGIIIFSGNSLKRLYLPQNFPLGELGDRWNSPLAKGANLSLSPLTKGGIRGVFDENSFSDLKKLLNQYFKGVKILFNLKPDLSDFSPFEKKVYFAVMKIPYGNVRSYKWVAGESGNLFAARAVGTALKKNPFPLIIPCHRVIKSDNSLGGYNAGTDWKRKLLRLEGLIY